MWFYPSTIPSGETEQLLFSAESKAHSSPDLFGPPQVQVHAALSILPDGRLKMYSSASVDEDHVFTAYQSKIRCARWTHLVLVWYPRMGGHPNLRMRIFFMKGNSFTSCYRAIPRWNFCRRHAAPLSSYGCTLGVIVCTIQDRRPYFRAKQRCQ